MQQPRDVWRIVVAQVHREPAEELVDVLVRVADWEEVDVRAPDDPHDHEIGQERHEEAPLVLLRRVVQLEEHHRRQ
jgi:hypothetical protein